MLQGNRVTLRAMQSGDAVLLTRFSNDVEVELLSGGTPPVPYPVDFWRQIIERRARTEGRLEADFMIESDGKAIGYCGLFHFDYPSNRAELAIAIGDRSYWGRGYGREVISLLLDYAFRIRNLHRVGLTVNGDNYRAQRSYRSCGFVEEGRLRDHAWSDGRYIDTIHMGILASEWKLKQSSSLTPDS